MWRTILTLLLFHSVALGAHVSKIIDPSHLELRLEGLTLPSPNSKLLVLSKKDGDPVAILRKRQANQAEVLELFENRMVTIGDPVNVIDLEQYQMHLPGSRHALSTDSKDIHSKYKPFFMPDLYASLTPTTAHTLLEREFLVGILGTVGYGLTPFWMVSTSVLFDALEIFNLRTKLKLLDNESMTLAVSITGLFSPEKELTFRQNLTSNVHGLFELNLDMPSSERLISQTSIRFGTTYSPLYSIGEHPLQGQPFLQVRSGYEYILFNFNRLQFGPFYDVENRVLGGYFNYVFVWRHLHLLLGLSGTYDFVQSVPHALPSLSVFWRF